MHHSFGCGMVDGNRRVVAGVSLLTAALRPRLWHRRVYCDGALRAALGRSKPEAIALRRAAHYSPPASAERSAARLAHQSGGLGVASSNLAAPTIESKTYLERQLSSVAPGNAWGNSSQ